MYSQVGDEPLPTQTLNGDFVGRIFSVGRCALPFVKQNIHSPSFLRTCSRLKSFGNSSLRKRPLCLTSNVTWMSSRYLIDARLIQVDKAFVRQLSRYVCTTSFSVFALTPYLLQSTIPSISDKIHVITPGA